MIDESDWKKVAEGVLDEKTLKTLYELSRRIKIDSISGFVKEGKESSILLAEDVDGNKIALKIYAIEASNFKRMKPYIKGDKRFEDMRKDRRHIILAWCKKEYKNLKLASEAGLRCPEPIEFRDNVIAMEFLGEDHRPSPPLSEIDIDNGEEIIDMIINDMKKLYDAGIVHGDLSQFNILLHEGEPYIIDLSQGVIHSHPEADNLLKRDIKNLVKYAKKIGVDITEDYVYQKVTEDGNEENS